MHLDLKRCTHTKFIYSILRAVQRVMRRVSRGTKAFIVIGLLCPYATMHHMKSKVNPHPPVKVHQFLSTCLSSIYL